jgi:hypothetical protein
MQSLPHDMIIECASFMMIDELILFMNSTNSDIRYNIMKSTYIADHMSMMLRTIYYIPYVRNEIYCVEKCILMYNAFISNWMPREPYDLSQNNDGSYMHIDSIILLNMFHLCIDIIRKFKRFHCVTRVLFHAKEHKLFITTKTDLFEFTIKGEHLGPGIIIYQSDYYYYELILPVICDCLNFQEPDAHDFCKVMLNDIRDNVMYSYQITNRRFVYTTLPEYIPV